MSLDENALLDATRWAWAIVCIAAIAGAMWVFVVLWLAAWRSVDSD